MHWALVTDKTDWSEEAFSGLWLNEKKQNSKNHNPTFISFIHSLLKEKHLVFF